MPMQIAKSRSPFSNSATPPRATAQVAQAPRPHHPARRGVRAGLMLMLPPAVVGLYLVKSALGINLLPGPSPLHDLFYHFIK